MVSLPRHLIQTLKVFNIRYLFAFISIFKHQTDLFLFSLIRNLTNLISSFSLLSPGLLKIIIIKVDKKWAGSQENLTIAQLGSGTVYCWLSRGSILVPFRGS